MKLREQHKHPRIRAHVRHPEAQRQWEYNQYGGERWVHRAAVSHASRVHEPAAAELVLLAMNLSLLCANGAAGGAVGLAALVRNRSYDGSEALAGVPKVAVMTNDRCTKMHVPTRLGRDVIRIRSYADADADSGGRLIYAPYVVAPEDFSPALASAQEAGRLSDALLMRRDAGAHLGNRHR